MNNIAIYLRKSRTDEELEKTIGEGETLKKHKKALLKYAKDKNLNIVEIKEEIVSGDSLFFRPEMLKLLQEVEANKYSGILVMDIDRLGRGGMKDQGIILEAFKESNTTIITPGKTYDLNNEYDEEITEFKTFFARRELKSITKRMQGGRTRSVEDGNYISTNPPLGYDIAFIQKSRTLKINEVESEIVKIIFNMYSESNGATAIAKHLNSLGFKTKIGNDFSPSSILFIIKNPIYIGKVTWKKKDIKKSRNPNQKTNTKQRDKVDWIISDGKHKPIISEELYNKCQDILNNRYHIPYQLTNAPVNPFAGLITCGVCSKKMTMRALRGVNRLMCTNKCGNVSSRFDLVENELLDSLEEYLKNKKFELNNDVVINNSEILCKQVNILEKEMKTLKDQKSKLFDFLERGIYDEDTFLDRSKNLDIRIKDTANNLNSLTLELNKTFNKTSKLEVITLENVIKAYKKTKDISLKNELLKSILYSITYNKDTKGDEFNLSVAPKLLR